VAVAVVVVVVVLVVVESGGGGGGATLLSRCCCCCCPSGEFIIFARLSFLKRKRKRTEKAEEEEEEEKKMKTLNRSKIAPFSFPPVDAIEIETQTDRQTDRQTDAETGTMMLGASSSSSCRCAAAAAARPSETTTTTSPGAYSSSSSSYSRRDGLTTTRQRRGGGGGGGAVIVASASTNNNIGRMNSWTSCSTSKRNDCGSLLRRRRKTSPLKATATRGDDDSSSSSSRRRRRLGAFVANEDCQNDKNGARNRRNTKHRTHAILPDSTPANTMSSSSSSSKDGNSSNGNNNGTEQVEGAQPLDESYAIPGITPLASDQEAKRDAVGRVSRLSSLVALKDLYRELIEAAALLEELKDFDATPLQDDLKGSFEYSDTAGGQSSPQDGETGMSLEKRCSNFEAVLEQVENIYQSRERLQEKLGFMDAPLTAMTKMLTSSLNSSNDEDDIEDALSAKKNNAWEIAFDEKEAKEDKASVIETVTKYDQELEALGNTFMEKCAFGTDVQAVRDRLERVKEYSIDEQNPGEYAGGDGVGGIGEGSPNESPSSSPTKLRRPLVRTVERVERSLKSPRVKNVVNKVLEPEVRKSVREKPGRALQSVASYSKNVWVRLNGGDPEDELDASTAKLAQRVVSNLPKPKSLKTEKEKLILRLLIEVQDRDKMFMEVMKARDAIAKEGKDSLSRVRLAEKVRKSEERVSLMRRVFAVRTLQTEMEKILVALDDEACEAPDRASLSELGLLVAEFGKMDAQLRKLVSLVDRKEVFLIEDEVLAQLAEDIPDMKSRLGIQDGGDSPALTLEIQTERFKASVNDAGSKLKEGAVFLFRGFKLLFSDLGATGRLFGVALLGTSLKPREVQTVRQTFLDLFTFIPFIIILITPITPLGHVLVYSFIQKYFPMLFPSQFTARRQALMQKYDELRAELKEARRIAEQREEDDTVKTAMAAVASVKGLIEHKDRAEFSEIDDKMAKMSVDDGDDTEEEDITG